jgi:hypothetical protein
VNENWDVEPSKYFREALTRYWNSEIGPPDLQSERGFEKTIDREDADLAAFLRFAKKLRDVAEKTLNPGSEPVYARNGKILPQVHVLREKPWTAFYTFRKARNDKEEDMWVGLHVFHDRDILENSIAHKLTLIDEEFRNVAI